MVCTCQCMQELAVTRPRIRDPTARGQPLNYISPLTRTGAGSPQTRRPPPPAGDRPSGSQRAPLRHEASPPPRGRRIAADSPPAARQGRPPQACARHCSGVGCAPAMRPRSAPRATGGSSGEGRAPGARPGPQADDIRHFSSMGLTSATRSRTASCDTDSSATQSLTPSRPPLPGPPALFMWRASRPRCSSADRPLLTCSFEARSMGWCRRLQSSL
mmetsp:Transcript_29675/g.83699  ORF Transcript_29675/g.83699 Transcript_29675/m.83699 type:complete len:216 (-) Transcript_29675:1196-1843(-)